MLKKILHRYKSGKKFRTPEVWGETLLPKLNHSSPLPLKSRMGKQGGGGEEASEFDTLVDVIQEGGGVSIVFRHFSVTESSMTV